MSPVQSDISLLADLLKKNSIMLATAESCTGGLTGHLITNEPGSSDWYLGGVVAYSNELKISLLNVDRELLDVFGAVSLECAQDMALGVARLCDAGAAVAVSGIAGPGGGTGDKPVGTVCFGWFVLGRTWGEKKVFQGSREEVKMQSAEHAVQGLVDYLQSLNLEAEKR
ncbi:CinA family protein [Desulfonatronospira sp.]|uniref:CinA family protein n=1 Tax=Desulfonatronospira sp. TaxID=1962951 RepID=UPI0025C3157B|nr:CinA family protein [Desulfonatronospira sp.]